MLQTGRKVRVVTSPSRPPYPPSSKQFQRLPVEKREEKATASVRRGTGAAGAHRSGRPFPHSSSPRAQEDAQGESGVQEATIGLAGLVDRLVPIDAEARPRQYAQGRRVAWATLFLVACSLLFVTMDLMRNIPDFLLAGLAAGTLYGGVVLAVLKASGSPRLAGHLLCGGFLADLTYQALMDTGLTNPAVAATLLLPWLASFTLGGAAALLYACLAAGLYMGLYVLYAKGYAFPFVASPDDVHVFLLVIYGIMVAVIAGIGYLYEQRREELFARRQRRAAANGEAGGEQTDAREPQGRIRPEVLRRLAQDLRVPLLDMIGLGTSLESSEGAPAGHGQLVAQDGRRAIELLEAADELAWLARPETRPMREEVEVAREAKRALRPLREEARRRDLRLCVEDDFESGTAWTDRRMMNRLVRRLVSFSIARAREGRVTVALGSDASNLRVRVKTSGARETPSHAQPASANGSASSQATSLDLIIAEHLAQTLGGQLDVGYTPDSGSVFVAILPLSSS